MSVYADTSLLVSHYITDANTARAQALLQSTTVPLPFTGLHRLELRNAQFGWSLPPWPKVSQNAEGFFSGIQTMG